MLICPDITCRLDIRYLSPIVVSYLIHPVTVLVASARIARVRYFVRESTMISSLLQSSNNHPIQLFKILTFDHRKKLKILLLLFRNFFDGVGPEDKTLDPLSFSSSRFIFLFSMLRVMSAQGGGPRNVVAVDA
jgi:hypothetical protein